MLHIIPKSHIARLLADRRSQRGSGSGRAKSPSNLSGRRYTLKSRSQKYIRLIYGLRPSPFGQKGQTLFAYAKSLPSCQMRRIR